MTATTRLGKVVGSIKTDPDGWTYWAERNWTTNEPGYITVAPSGARMRWFADEADAQAEVERQNADWFEVA